MPIAISSTSSPPNTTVTFNFADKVLAYVVGVTYWKFSFGKDDHHVKTLTLALSNNQPTPTQITTRITAKLDDDSGHGISSNDSSVHLSCIAVIQGNDGNISLANARGIASGSASAAIALPGNALSIGAAFLSGWSLEQSGDHHVKTFETTAGFAQNGNSGQITSEAQMIDTSGNFASGSIDGGLLAASTSEFGVVARALINQQTGSASKVDFGQPLGPNAAVMLQSLRATFGSKDHHVKTIGGGCSSWSVDGSTVTLSDARAFITDDSGHSQSDSDSSVSLVVFAIPS